MTCTKIKWIYPFLVIPREKLLYKHQWRTTITASQVKLQLLSTFHPDSYLVWQGAASSTYLPVFSLSLFVFVFVCLGGATSSPAEHLTASALHFLPCSCKKLGVILLVYIPSLCLLLFIYRFVPTSLPCTQKWRPWKFSFIHIRTRMLSVANKNTCAEPLLLSTLCCFSQVVTAPLCQLPLCQYHQHLTTDPSFNLIQQ